MPQIENVPMPEWLGEITEESFRNMPFPLEKILRHSCFYPASYDDGKPVKAAAGHVHNFVYVDCGFQRADEGEAFKEEIIRKLRGEENQPSGFVGYRVLGIRSLTERELAPRGYVPSFPFWNERYRERIASWNWKNPFALWAIFERLDGRGENHGPQRFSLVYICGEGVASFDALYIQNRIRPEMLAIIQPGTGWGGNWTDFRDADEALGQAVLRMNPAGPPRYIITDETTPYWPMYSVEAKPLRPMADQGIYVWTRPEETPKDVREGTTADDEK